MKFTYSRVSKESNLWILGNLGIAPLIIGAIMTPLIITTLIRREDLRDNGGIGLALAFGIAFLLIGIGTIVYGWWCDRRESLKFDEDGPSHK